MNMSMYKRIMDAKEKRMSIKNTLNNQTFRVVLGAFIFTFTILCSVNMSGMSTKGYDIAELENQVTALQRENQRIDLKIAEYRSMQSIQDRLNDSDLVKADNIKYYTLVGSTVARR